MMEKRDMGHGTRDKETTQEMTDIDRILQVVERLKIRFDDTVEEVKVHNGEVTVTVKRESLLEAMRYLRDEERFEMLVDATAVDYLPLRGEPRFEVVYHLLSLTHRLRLRVKVRLQSADAWVPTVCHIYPSANPYEREIWDMFGIRIEGHPNLKRILTYDEFPGHRFNMDGSRSRQFGNFVDCLFWYVAQLFLHQPKEWHDGSLSLRILGNDVLRFFQHLLSEHAHRSIHLSPCSDGFQR